MSILYEILVAALLSLLFSQDIENPKKDQNTVNVEQVSKSCPKILNPKPQGC